MREWLGLPLAATAQAGQIDDILVLVHWLMLVLFVGWTTFFLYVLVRYRRAANPAASYEDLKATWARSIEAAILAAEVVLLTFFSIPAWSNRVDAFPAERDSVVIHVVAEQYAWNVHYPGPDGRFGRTEPRLVTPDNPLGLDRDDPAARDDVTTINEMNVPVNRPVIVYLSSKDVVHSFGIPQLRVKQDMVPGTIQPVWFTPTRTGQWDIACSQLCGLGHFRMKAFINVQTAADFDTWMAAGRP